MDQVVIVFIFSYFKNQISRKLDFTTKDVNDKQFQYRKVQKNK